MAEKEETLTLEDLVRQDAEAADGITRLAGPCCACGRVGLGGSNHLLRSVLMLPFRVPEWDGQKPVGGWGCVVCDLPREGAVAFVCDPCLAADVPVKTFVLGDPRDGRRGPVEALTEPWAHDMALHRKLGF